MESSCGAGCAGKKDTCGAPDAAAARQKLAISDALARIRHKLLVMSGKGGVGKSTVSVNLAIGLARRGYRVGLMDVDLHGPDICRMLNLTEPYQGRMVNGKMPAMQYGDSLKVMSLENMLENRDDPVIWRGPLKNQAIRRFLADVDWGELDYLVIDAPPGTGDEPLSVANLIKDVKAVVVTTPQQVALADVRKSLNFCKQVKMEIAGLVENMSGLLCPHCGKLVELFKSGGGEALAAEYGLPFLGRIPLDPLVVLAGDDGAPYLSSGATSPAVAAFTELVAKIEAALPAKATGLSLASAPSPLGPSLAKAGCACQGKCDPDLCNC